MWRSVRKMREGEREREGERVKGKIRRRNRRRRLDQGEDTVRKRGE